MMVSEGDKSRVAWRGEEHEAIHCTLDTTKIHGVDVERCTGPCRDSDYCRRGLQLQFTGINPLALELRRSRSC